MHLTIIDNKPQTNSSSNIDLLSDIFSNNNISPTPALSSTNNAFSSTNLANSNTTSDILSFTSNTPPPVPVLQHPVVQANPVVKAFDKAGLQINM
jgi:hypothetical protein